MNWMRCAMATRNGFIGFRCKSVEASGLIDSAGVLGLHSVIGMMG